MPNKRDIAARKTYERDAPPDHFVLKMTSFSSLVDTQANKYESTVFKAGGHKWRLVLYPNEMIEGKASISLYLALADQGFIRAVRAAGICQAIWREGLVGPLLNAVAGPPTVHAYFRLFVLNQRHDNYLTIEEADGGVSEFTHEKNEVGFANIFPNKRFEKSYLRNDNCVFGAEVFVTEGNKREICDEHLFLKKPTSHNRTFHVKLPAFSSSRAVQDHICPDLLITAGSRKWKLKIYPKGKGQEKNNSLSVFLILADDSQDLPSVFAEFKVRVMNHAHKNKMPNIEKEGKHWFSSINYEDTWGWPKFMALKDLHKSFLVNDTLSVEVEILNASSFP